MFKINTLLRKTTFACLICALSFFTTSCSDDKWLKEIEKIFKDQTDKTQIPAEIKFTEEALYPEGVSHDAKGERFLVSSVRFGTIGIVKYNGMYTPFVESDKLVSTVGIKVDEARKRVLVAVSDPGAGVKTSPQTAGKLAALGIFDLTTGQEIKFVNLGALRPESGHFANDLTLDPQGNAYITDSFSPIIYKVDVQGNATVFFENEAFATSPGQFGFNGIAYHPSGYLIVGFSRANELYKIPVDNTSAFSKIMLDTQLMGPDGLLLSNNGKQLIVVNNAGGMQGKVLSFESDDKWETGKLKNTFDTGAVFPTTATAYKKEVFVVYAYLNRLFGGANAPVSEFTIKKVPFENMNF